jgi:signal transduction histidine kinase
MEALTNTVKHARAKRVELLVAEADGCVRLRIADDGVGLSPEHSDGRGLGLIRRRVARLGGALTLDTTAPQGLALELTLPNAIPPSEEDRK